MTFCIFTRSTTYHNKSGGLETQNLNLIEGLAKIGHKIIVVTTGLNKDSVSTEQRDPLITYFFTNSPSGIYSNQWFKESTRTLNEILNKEKIDVLISQSSSGVEVFRKIKNIKKIAISHGSSFGELETRFKTIKSLRNFIRFVILDIKMTFLGWIEDFMLFKNSNKVVCVSLLVKKRLNREFPFFKDKFVVIDNGVDIDKFKVAKPKALSKKDFIILFVGRVVKEKGVELLLNALADLNSKMQYKLVVVGGGPDLENYKKIAKGFGIFADFVGEVSNKDTVKYYQMADIFVLPTLRQEGFPMVLAEAMGAGLPIIASRIGGIPSAIKDGQNGILVSPSSKEDLSRAITLLYQDKKFKERLSNNSLESSIKYSRKAMTASYLNLIYNIK